MKTLPFVAIAACASFACAHRVTAQESVTIELEPDKTVLKRGEPVTISVYAQLNPGIGSPVWFVPWTWTKQIQGEIDHLTWAQFWFISQSQPVQWLAFTKNPYIWYGEPGPIFTPNAIVKLTCNPSNGYYVDRSWLFDVTFKLTDYTPGEAIFGLQINSPPGGAIQCQGAAEHKGAETLLYGLKTVPLQWSPLAITILPASCQADCDANGALTIDDFICYQTLFANGDPQADCDASGQLSIDDFICFQTAFVLGC